MKSILFVALIALATSCSHIDGTKLAPNHVALKPGYQVEKCDDFRPIHTYKLEGQLDWSW